MKKFFFKNKELYLFDLLWVLGLGLLAFILLVFLFRKDEYINVTIKITNDNVLYSQTISPAWFSYFFREGMKEKDGLGRTRAEIKRVYIYNTSPDKKALYLLLRIKATFNKRTNQYSYKGRPLLIGAFLKVEFQRILANGLVTEIEGMEDLRKIKEIIVETQVMDYQTAFPSTRGVDPYLAEEVREGDVVRDLDGEAIITVLEKRVKPAQRVSVDSLGRAHLIQDPLKKDLYLKLKLKIKEVNHEYYLFDDIRVSVSQKIPVHFDTLTLYPTIIKIYQ